MRKTVNWKKVWNDFDEWTNERSERKECEACHHAAGQFPDWNEQQEMIKRLVNTQVREIVEKEN